jgi:hypothetical protein
MSKLVELNISEIELDRDNPRIKHFLEIYQANKITAEAIALALSNSANANDTSTSFAGLRDSIKVSKGIIHPIIVSHEADGRYVVIEGNTRLHIYKEFNEYEPDGTWAKIPALVYEQLSDVEKHKIRLQSHLVGPREWDPYSKAKYLWQLSEVEHMPMTSIISLCGGRKAEIQKSIDAYLYMETVYRPIIKSKGLDFNVRDFSKFAEYQNSNIKKSIQSAGYDEDQFAKWVADDMIDVALKVRRLTEILKNNDAKNKFLHSNLTEAERILHASELDNADLSKYPYYVIVQELYKKLALGEPKVDEIKELAKGESEESNKRKYYLESLNNQIKLILKFIRDFS